VGGFFYYDTPRNYSTGAKKATKHTRMEGFAGSIPCAFWQKGQPVQVQ
jgi:hypothetical protein